MSTKLVNVKVVCRLCNKEFTLRVTEDQIENYQNGMLVQNAFPQLTAAQRELIISGTCGDCWNKIFPPEEIPTQPFN